MNYLPEKFCGFPIYLQMDYDLSFSCFCPSETGSNPCKLHPNKNFQTLNIHDIIKHVKEHISAGDEKDNILKNLVKELTEFIPLWKKQVKMRGGVG